MDIPRFEPARLSGDNDAMRSIILIGSAVVVVAFIAVMAIQSTPHQASPPMRQSRLQWGIYQMLWSRDYGRHIRRTIEPFASAPNYIMFYRDLGRPFPKLAVDAIHDIGATPMVSLELWKWHGKHKGSYLQAINDGEYDDFFRAWARSSREDGRRIMLRFGFEFNGDWFTWSLKSGEYISAWRRARDIFRQERAENVEWVWSPNVVNCPDTAANDMHLYYPGEKYVDWVSVDGYNFGENHDRWHHWQSFEDVFGELLRDFAKRYPDKPIILSEFGCAPGKGKQREQWIHHAYATLRNHPQVKAVIWFNLDKRREGEPNWRIDVTPQSLRAFNETFARHRPDRPTTASRPSRDTP